MNRSMDFAEKVRWHIAHDNAEPVARLQDKLHVKEFVESRGVCVAATLAVTESARELPLTALPPTCVIKPNHGSGWVILRKDGAFYQFGTGKFVLDERGELLPRSSIFRHELSDAETIDQCDAWLRSKFSTVELSYHRIAPLLIAEEYLTPAVGGDLRDYRFYTFHGKVRAISVGSPTYRRLKRNAFFTPEWEQICLTSYSEALPDTLPEKPQRLDEMRDIASRLGAGIDFVRIDLYDTTKGIVFGEFTFYPHAGDPGTPTACSQFNEWLGRDWPLRPLDFQFPAEQRWRRVANS